MPADPETWETSLARSLPFLLAFGLLRSILGVRPLTRPLDYYRAVILAVARTLLSGTPTNPCEFLRGETWVRYEGCDYLLTPDTMFGYYLHFYEPRTARLLESLSGEVFVDVGANTGQYAVPLARKFRRVLAVEPNPIAISVLRRNLARNEISNVEIAQVAVMASPGHVRLFRGAFLTTWSVFQHSKDFIDVDAVSLDEILKPFGSVDLLKVDIEDAEVEAILAATSLGKVKRISLATLAPNLPSIRRALEAQGFGLRTTPGLFGSPENYWFLANDLRNESPSLQS